jgi:hypothetical protein
MTPKAPTSEATRQGKDVAAVLAGTWRLVPPGPDRTIAAYAHFTSLLVEGGAGGLAWWRFRQLGNATFPTTRVFRQEYRQIAAAALEQEEHIRQAVGCLRAAGIEPLLIKGWSVARLYADPGLRPLGDIDLCVRPDQLDSAAAALATIGLPFGTIDLHRGVPDAPARAWDEIYQRSQLVPLGDTDVRILGPENLLRLLCLHFVRHECCRPLWLCDVAAVLESQGADFDWDYCLTSKRRIAQWVLCVVGLAQRLLGARVAPANIAARAGLLPRWLVPAVLWRWATPAPFPPFVQHLRSPREFLQAVLYRRLNPIKIAYRLRLPPRTPWPLLQLLYPLSRPAWAACLMYFSLARWLSGVNPPVLVDPKRVF